MTFFDSCIFDIGVVDELSGSKSQSGSVKCPFSQRKVLHICTDHFKTKREFIPLDDFYEMVWVGGGLGYVQHRWRDAGGWYGSPAYHASVKHPDSIFIPKQRLLDRQLGILFSRTGSWVYNLNFFTAYITKDKVVDPKGIVMNDEKRSITEYVNEITDDDSRIYIIELMEYLSYIHSMSPYFPDAKWHWATNGCNASWSLVHNGAVILMANRGLRTTVYGGICDGVYFRGHLNPQKDAVDGIIYNPAYANSIDQSYYNEYPRAFLLTDGIESIGVAHIHKYCINVSIDSEFTITFSKSSTMPTILIGEGILCFDISKCLILDIEKGRYTITSDVIRDVFKKISDKIDPHQHDFEKLVRRVTIFHDRNFLVKEIDTVK